MIHCKKCNKLISDLNDLNVTFSYNVLKTESYCNNCSAVLLRNGRFGGNLNGERSLKFHYVTGLFFALILVFLGIGVINDPGNLKLWAGGAIVVFLTFLWKKRYENVKRTIEEVRNTPSVKMPEKNA